MNDASDAFDTLATTLMPDRRAQTRAQGLAFEQLGDGVRGRVLPDEVVEGDQVRVGERGHRAHLRLEPLQGFGVLGKALGQHLDGYVAPQTGVVGAVHLALPPAPSGAAIS